MNTLQLEESTSTLKIFKCTLRFRSTLKYATSDLPGISKSSSLNNTRLRLAFLKLFDMEMPVKCPQSCIWTITFLIK